MLLSSVMATTESSSAAAQQFLSSNLSQLVSRNADIAPQRASGAPTAELSSKSEHDRISISILQQALILGGFIPIIISLANSKVNARCSSSLNASKSESFPTAPLASSSRVRNCAKLRISLILPQLIFISSNFRYTRYELKLVDVF
jgi:hypothetical protein